ncbi:hypothetical protein D5086_010986 [Populus alba]|uniref:Uncharacterized protein n=1 Tax=Populus alba TaxID=43335 RepID=A0ACC4CBE8_POPAL
MAAMYSTRQLLADGLNLLFFDGITNKDFLDGTGLQFKSVTVGKYLCAEAGGGSIIVANRTSAQAGKRLVCGGSTKPISTSGSLTNNSRVWIPMAMGIDIVAVSSTPGRSETFEIVRNSNDTSRVRIKASNGFFLQAKTEELLTADYAGDSKWGDDDPSVFVMTIAGRLQGEFQVTNGYGPKLAPKVMRDHWRTFIVEDDFKFISQNGINAVRIPVGWWIASDPTPPQPYVGGSLKALDNAFLWAQYAKSPSLYAVELMNEPRAPGASLDSMTKYYKAGYDAVRKHSSTAYVVMSNRLSSDDPRELFPLASGLTGSVIDVHYYNLFSDEFNSMSVQQNIDFINTNRSSQLNHVTTSNGPLTFVGEWVAEWTVQGATKRITRDLQRPVGGLWESYFWVGLLDSKECKQSLEPGVDDQEWLHQDIDFNSESPV